MAPEAPRGAVLVVDDNEEDRAAVAAALEREGYAVRRAGSGFDAGELLAGERFDAVVTDLVMPGMSGFEVIQAAREADPDTVCIAMTSHGALDSALDAINMGAYSYLTKPCDARDLRLALSRGLERRRLTRDLRERNRQLEALNRELDAKVQQATADLRELNRRVLNEMAGLRELDQIKSAFLGNVSHDLRSPLTTITGFAGLLQEDASLSEEARTCVEGIATSAAHMNDLIGQILEATRLSAGKVELRLVELSPAEVLREAATIGRGQAEEAGLRLEAEAPEGLPPLRADKGRLLQILGNLVGNACKFTPRGGRVLLRAEAAPEGTVFTVEDTGVGIAPEHHAKIFEKFYQVSGSPARFKGLGLGLRIVKELVELHGGRIWVESVPGQGSRFRFLLPSPPAR